MQALLEQRNYGLLRDLDILLQQLAQAQVPPELLPYRDQIVWLCQDLRTRVTRNLGYLKLGRAEIMADVLSQTQQAMQEVRLLSSNLVIPIVRATLADRLCLTTIGWLHQTHPKTEVYPPAFTSGYCAIRPFLKIAPIYFFPSIEQNGLLYQPLFFHEFGHLLYACHKREMDDLVRELQRDVEDLLLPTSQRNDSYYEAMTAQRQAIADRWYAWTQELFCDAVGFTIGGPCFLQAFSGFLSMMDPGDFYRQPVDLQYSSHPVKWLRVHFLARRASESGYPELAEEIETEWQTIAQVMDIVEDYYGFYDESLAQVISHTIDDMLTEAAPRQCSELEAAGDGWSPFNDSLVRLLNWSWQVKVTSPEHYTAWEAEKIQQLLGDHPIVEAQVLNQKLQG